MSSTSTRQRTVLVAVAVVLATLVGGIALTGSAVAAENLQDGSTTHPSTGEYVYAANASEKKSITYGYVVENVTNTGESVELVPFRFQRWVLSVAPLSVTADEPSVSV